MSSWEALPITSLLHILAFLTGDDEKSFSVQAYKTDVITLFRADPSLFACLNRDNNFRSLVRRKVETTVLRQLRSEPQPASPIFLNNFYRTYKDALAPQQR